MTEQEQHDCSNCKFSKQVAPYKILLECELDMETVSEIITIQTIEEMGEGSVK